MIAGTTAAVVASSAANNNTTVVINTMPVGSVVAVLPPNCAQVTRADVTYYSCDNVWYKPQYQASGVTYLIVNPPE
ncbi:hypothetical protein EDF56_102538 [Novosphingobium sp. PhB165]|nr:hypothetical protein EDF56_102538 [Novosphingobium sp. PhB165]